MFRRWKWTRNDRNAVSRAQLIYTKYCAKTSRFVYLAILNNRKIAAKTTEKRMNKNEIWNRQAVHRVKHSVSYRCRGEEHEVEANRKITASVRQGQRRHYLRAMARYREMAGDPGGVCNFESSLSAVCLTVMVCLKSNGNDICPGSRFKSCKRRDPISVRALDASNVTNLQSALAKFTASLFRRWCWCILCHHNIQFTA